MKRKKAKPLEEFIPHPMDVALGLRIRAIRKEQKISQDTLAKQIGISFQQVQKYEHGANRISFSRMLEMARALNLSVITLIEPLVERDGQTMSRTTNHLGLLRDAQSLELLTLFNELDGRPRKTAVLRFVRDLVRSDHRPAI